MSAGGAGAGPAFVPRPPKRLGGRPRFPVRCPFQASMEVVIDDVTLQLQLATDSGAALPSIAVADGRWSGLVIAPPGAHYNTQRLQMRVRAALVVA